MTRRRILEASTTLGGVPRAPHPRTYGTSTVGEAATTMTLAKLLEAMATVQVHVTTVELGERGHRNMLAALRTMADQNSNVLAADVHRSSTYAGIRIVERPDFAPDQAELVFSDGHREALDVRQRRDA